MYRPKLMYLVGIIIQLRQFLGWGHLSWGGGGGEIPGPPLCITPQDMEMTSIRNTKTENTFKYIKISMNDENL